MLEQVSSPGHLDYMGEGLDNQHEVEMEKEDILVLKLWR